MFPQYDRFSVPSPRQLAFWVIIHEHTVRYLCGGLCEDNEHAVRFSSPLSTFIFIRPRGTDQASARRFTGISQGPRPLRALCVLTHVEGFLHHLSHNVLWRPRGVESLSCLRPGAVY